MADERVEIAAGVGDKPELQPLLLQLSEHRHDVVVELEVPRVLPAAHDLTRDDGHLRAVAAHAADDVLGEAHPDLLVVVELGMPLEIVDRSRPCVPVQLRVELQAVRLAEPGRPPGRAPGLAARA